MKILLFLLMICLSVMVSCSKINELVVKLTLEDSLNMVTIDTTTVIYNVSDTNIIHSYYDNDLYTSDTLSTLYQRRCRFF